VVKQISSSGEPGSSNQYPKLEISAHELKSKLYSREEEQQPIMIFDIGDEGRYKREHIGGSRFLVCDQETKNTILPKMPKGIEIILVAKDENYTKEMVQMARDKTGHQTRYLQGGLATWKWEKTTSLDPRISARDLKHALDQGKIGREIFLLDVRESDEFEIWNIDNSENIPLGQIPQSIDRIPKDKEIITICPAGNRSAMVTMMLQRLGYNAKTLDDGLKSWSSAYEHVNQTLEVEDGKSVQIIQLRRFGKGYLSYIIECGCKAAVIDPLLPIEDYIRIAGEEMNAKIIRVMILIYMLTMYQMQKNFLNRQKQSFILAPMKTNDIDNLDRLSDGDVITIGSVPLKAIYTPGHTQGSISLWLGSKILFTGDTLFINNVGRPDLKEQTEELASKLHDSIKNTIFKLPDETIILPAHHDSPVSVDTLIEAQLGDVKNQQNVQGLFRLQKEQFVQKMNSITMPTPASYKEIMPMNKGMKGISTLREIHRLEMGPNRCSV
jgi:rhodanese-related sulfurtransferase